jgi:hypothetical protein
MPRVPPPAVRTQNYCYCILLYLISAQNKIKHTSRTLYILIDAIEKMR